MHYNRQWLMFQQENGKKLRFLFFWGHQPTKDGSISDSCFSQWWQAPFTVEGLTYLTAEHWMMAGKARLFGDQEVLGKILAVQSPAEAKKLGRQVRNFDAQRWDEHKYEMVKAGNVHKFSQHVDLKEYLLQTGNRIIVEASPMDQIWGIGMAKSNPNAENPTLWKGENLLGFALMEVRDALQE